MGDHMYPSSGEPPALMQMGAARLEREEGLRFWLKWKREGEKREAAVLRARLNGHAGCEEPGK